MKDVTAIIKTFMRPYKLERCLRAVIDAGVSKVIIGYDGPDSLWAEHKEIFDYYTTIVDDIQLKRFSFNYGLSNVRNKMIDMTNTDYILMLDDDQYVPSNTLEIIPFLGNHADIGIIGIGYIEYGNYGRMRIEAMDFEIINGYLNQMVKQPKKMEQSGSLAFLYPFEYAPNCALFKHEVFDDVRWDNNYVIGGEHMDFYMHLKSMTNWKVALCLSLFAFHDMARDNKDFLKYRVGIEKVKSEAYFLKKWGLEGVVSSWKGMYLDNSVYIDVMLQRNHSFTQKLKEKRFSEISKKDMSRGYVINKDKIDLYMFQEERNMQRIKELKDKHKGERCFVIGTGPSLNKTDFKLIKDEILFGVNTLYRGHKTFNINPQYYACSDYRIWRVHDAELLQLDTTLFLVSSVTSEYRKQHNHYLRTEKYHPLIITHRGVMYDAKKFSTNLEEGTYNGNTIIIDLPLQICFYMGFSEVYLLGCDHDYSGMHRFDGLQSEGSNTPIVRGDWSIVDANYELCKQTYEKANRKIYNSTVGGKLEIFEHRRLEDIVV